VNGKQEGKGVCCEWKAGGEGNLLWIERRKERVYCEWKEGRGESLLWIEYRKGRGDCYG